MNPWIAITSLGDAACMVSAAAAIAAALTAIGAWRPATVWVCAFAAGALVVMATKLAFLGWGVGIGAVGFTGASGHTAFAMAVCLTAAYLVSKEAAPAWRAVTWGLGGACGLAVGVSRLILRLHSPSEVVAGCLVGIAVALVFAGLTRDLRSSAILRLMIVAGLVVVASTAQGKPTPTQDWLIRFALELSGHSKPYMRKSGGAGTLDAGAEGIAGAPVVAY